MLHQTGKLCCLASPNFHRLAIGKVDLGISTLSGYLYWRGRGRSILFPQCQEQSAWLYEDWFRSYELNSKSLQRTIFSCWSSSHSAKSHPRWWFFFSLWRGSSFSVSTAVWVLSISQSWIGSPLSWISWTSGQAFFWELITLVVGSHSRLSQFSYSSESTWPSR